MSVSIVVATSTPHINIHMNGHVCGAAPKGFLKKAQGLAAQHTVTWPLQTMKDTYTSKV
jgi:hypothetical protein